MARGGGVQSSKNVQILLVIFAVSALCLFFLRPSPSIVDRTSRLYSAKHESIESNALLFATEDIVDYRRCSPSKPFRFFVHSFDHPLAAALAAHPAATDQEDEACLFFSFTDGNNPSVPPTWNSVAQSGLNHVVVKINEETSVEPLGREMIVQASFEDGTFRPIIDLSLSPDVEPFDKDTWLHRPSIMPLKRAIVFSLVVDFFDPALDASRIPQVECEADCASSLLASTFCLLPVSRSFHFHLLESLRAGCIPVVMSTSQPLPFQDQLDWQLASFRYPRSLISQVPELLEEVDKEDIMEMRRRGRVFLTRIDDAQALAKSLVAALSERIHVSLPVFPEVVGNLIATNKNETSNFTRIHSPFGSKTRTANRLYSRARWNSGRDLTYTPSTLHDVPQMPGEAPFYDGTKEHLVAVNGGRRLGLTRDEEQFTVMILTYNRDNGVKKIIERLRDCPHLNKVIIVWNNQERRPNGTWPEIHVPVEIVLSEKNSLSSRFLPFDRIETEAVVAIDDDMDLGQPELTFGFRMWRENRDRVVGYPDRYHTFKKGRGWYGYNGNCEYSMILTSFAFVHKEFLFEYSFNQHPAILEYIDKYQNCEDIAINYLVSHLTRKPPLKVVKKAGLSNGSKTGLSGDKDHYNERHECVRMFNQLFGYNPLLFSQEVARPSGSCVKGL